MKNSSRVRGPSCYGIFCNFRFEAISSLEIKQCCERLVKLQGQTFQCAVVERLGKYI